MQGNTKAGESHVLCCLKNFSFIIMFFSCSNITLFRLYVYTASSILVIKQHRTVTQC